MRNNYLAIALYFSVNIILSNAGRPNILFVLTDDQDVTMGGETPMVKTKKLIGDKGIQFKNMFVSSPLCCPSRSSIITGRYVHNHHAIDNSIQGNCSSTYWQKEQEATAFPTLLKSLGYSTFFAGKYLNQYGTNAAGGVEHVPPGWDHWNGLVGNSVYYNYRLSVNGKEEKHGNQYPQDYLTDVIHKRAVDFLEKRGIFSDPFFMMLSTPACHGPFTPAPQFNSSYANMTAPRQGSYNVQPKNKHWLIQQTIVPMPNDTVQSSDDIFRRRWRTLMSVDDMVENVINILDRKGELDNTYIFFSSDNGYHLGQFGLPFDKRQLYEFDIRVPLMVRGPGIKAGEVSEEVVLNIDFAPTFIDIANRTVLPNTDGISILPILHPNSNSTIPLRNTFLVEHHGEYSDKVEGCPRYTGQGLGYCNNHCVCEDSKNNTFGCVIQFEKTQILKYCEFMDNDNFIEIYDTKKDPNEFSNMKDTVGPKTIQDLGKKLRFLANCAGPDCNTVPTF